MPIEDKQLRLRVMREIARRSLDSTRVQVYVRGNTAWLAGRIRPLRGHSADMSKEMEIIVEMIRRIPGISEVVCELQGPAGERYKPTTLELTD